MLQALLTRQKMLQEKLNQPMGDGVQGIKENALALIVEVTELLNEFNWKLWRKKQKRIVRSQVVEEMADVLIFYMNICNELEISAEELYHVTSMKQEKVHERYIEEISTNS